MTTTATTDAEQAAMICAVPEESTPLVSTGRAARALSIAPRTLQRYLEAGIVRPAEQTAGGHHRWDVDDLRRQIRDYQRQRATDDSKRE